MSLFFFSSRRRHTRFDCDWSSDVCSSDLVYANTTRAIYASNSTGAKVWNNTAYSVVGDALRFENSSNASVRNNILWVEAGSAIFVASNAQTGFTSDRNILYKGAGGGASIGFWDNAPRSHLRD